MTKSSNSGLWKHGLLLTMLFGFTVMLVGGAYIYKTRAPIPAAVTDNAGNVLFTAQDIQAGQELFRKRNLMNYGSVLGHGAYLGPDYTAEALHTMTLAMQADRSNGRFDTLSLGDQAGINAEIAHELKINRYRESDGNLVFTPGQAKGFASLVDQYTRTFTAGQPERSLTANTLIPLKEGGANAAVSREAARQMSAFVTWTAWLSVAKRPEANHS